MRSAPASAGCSTNSVECGRDIGARQREQQAAGRAEREHAPGPHADERAQAERRRARARRPRAASSAEPGLGASA